MVRLATQQGCENITVSSSLQLLQAAAERVEAYCGLWRDQGAAWWTQMLQAAVPPPPAGGHWSASHRTDAALLRKTLWHAAAAGLVCDIRIGHGVEIHGSTARRRLLPLSPRYLLVTFSRASTLGTKLSTFHQHPPAQQPRPLTVVVGLEGLPQEERNAWNRYVKREPSTPGEYVSRLLWSHVVRTRPWNHLFAAGWRVLYVAGPPVSRQQAVDDIIAHCVVYLWQAQTIEREDVSSWLQAYIRQVCKGVSQHEVDYLLEVGKAFALPLHANGLRAFLTFERGQSRRAEHPDPRLVRGMDAFAADNAADAEQEASATAQVSLPPHRKSRRRDVRHADTPSLSPRQCAAVTGLKPHQVKYRIRTGDIPVERRGRSLRIAAGEARRQLRQQQIKALEKELLRVRVLWRSRGGMALGDEDTLRHAWDAARKWMKEQQKKQKTPAEVYAMIAAAPAIQTMCQKKPDLLSRAQALLERLGHKAA